MGKSINFFISYIFSPYHQPGQATGLSFAIGSNCKIPPSLRNIEKELRNCYPKKIFTRADLTKWAEQGVLLLNTCLTVEKSKAFSHKKKGWLIFTTEVIKLLNEKCENIIFVLWGKPAEKKSELINQKKHKIIKSSHPSPLSATRTSTPFIGSKCFHKINEFLKSKDEDEIKWL